MRNFLGICWDFSCKETPSATADSLKATGALGTVGSLVATGGLEKMASQVTPGSLIAADTTGSVGGTCLVLHDAKCFKIWTFLITVFGQ